MPGKAPRHREDVFRVPEQALYVLVRVGCELRLKTHCQTDGCFRMWRGFHAGSYVGVKPVCSRPKLMTSLRPVMEMALAAEQRPTTIEWLNVAFVSSGAFRS